MVTALPPTTVGMNTGTPIFVSLSLHLRNNPAHSTPSLGKLIYVDRVEVCLVKVTSKLGVQGPNQAHGFFFLFLSLDGGVLQASICNGW